MRLISLSIAAFALLSVVHSMPVTSGNSDLQRQVAESLQARHPDTREDTAATASLKTDAGSNYENEDQDRRALVNAQQEQDKMKAMLQAAGNQGKTGEPRFKAKIFAAEISSDDEKSEPEKKGEFHTEAQKMSEDEHHSRAKTKAFAAHPEEDDKEVKPQEGDKETQGKSHEASAGKHHHEPKEQKLAAEPANQGEEAKPTRDDKDTMTQKNTKDKHAQQQQAKTEALPFEPKEQSDAASKDGSKSKDATTKAVAPARLDDEEDDKKSKTDEKDAKKKEKSKKDKKKKEDDDDDDDDGKQSNL